MKIYGVALLAGCFLTGKLIGNILGEVIGINGDIGGVGFAMLLLMLLTTWMRKKGLLVQETGEGILFWTSMYIPIIVAMAATLNVKAAISGGWIAIFAGLSATVACFLLVPLISRVGQKQNTGE